MDFTITEKVPSELIFSQSIFDSLKASYPAFDAWVEKISEYEENRHCLLIENWDCEYHAIVIMKLNEDDNAYDFVLPVTKISTFKVMDAFMGRGYGTSLLVKAETKAKEIGASTIYLEVLPTRQDLIRFLTEKGYSALDGMTTPHGEIVLSKLLG